MASAQLFLNGARVTREFRDALLGQANRAGITPNEFCITDAAEKLRRSGASVPGVFRPGDLSELGRVARWPARTLCPNASVSRP